MEVEKINIQYMKRALELSELGEGMVNPNPKVGAVIVHEEKIIGEGYHQKYGENHAEVNAIKDAIDKGNGELIEDSEMYVTLEPCCHYGKTPPCTQAIINNKIKKVYIGCLDKNELVGGKGVKILRENGVEVHIDLMREEIEECNKIFFKYISTKIPYVIMKVGTSMDGKIATCTGKSKWITGSAAREHAHKQRSKVMGIMVGVNTVIADDPELTVRHVENWGRQPFRIVVDTNGRIPVDSKLVREEGDRTFLVCGEGLSKDKQVELESYGVSIIKTKVENNRVVLKDALERLGANGIDSLIIEGGGEIHFSALKEKLVDEIHHYMAPMIIGGKHARSMVWGRGFEELKDAPRIKDINIERIGEDIFIEGKFMWEGESDVHRDS